jgi:hypothetical protein
MLKLHKPLGLLLNFLNKTIWNETCQKVNDWLSGVCSLSSGLADLPLGLRG